LDGKRYYLKFPRTTDHAKNEILSAVLFAAGGGSTLTYHRVFTAVDEFVAGTDFIKLEKSNLMEFSYREQDEAKQDFGLHAWLGNWDIVSHGGNIGVYNGKVISMDFDGGLLYDGEGGPKLDSWNPYSDEWVSMRERTPRSNFYTNISEVQLRSSALRLNGISDDLIYRLAMKHGPGTKAQRAELSTMLILRKQSILQKSGWKLSQS